MNPKIRCHRLGDLMTGVISLTANQTATLQKYQDILDVGKAITEKQYIEYGQLLEKKHSKEISQTVKTLALDVWLWEQYGYKEPIFTDELKKGLLLESEAITLLCELDKTFRSKNKQNFTSDILTGTPDVILKDHVEDIKCSSNIKTFFQSELTKAYYWQGIGYMILTGKTHFKLRYVLLPDPEEIILDKEKRLYYKFDCNEENPDYIKATKQIRHNNEVILSIPKEHRVRTFEFDLEPDLEEAIKTQYDKFLNYYQTTFK